MGNELLVSNIQRYCFKDGPGIRTTVFLMGCNLRCPWCANPENLTAVPKTIFENGVGKTCGKYYTSEALVAELLKDEWVFQRGGVTFSGGEPLLWSNQLIPVLRQLKDHKIHVCVETALGIEMELIDQIIKYVDIFLVDIKTVNGKIYKNYFNGDIDQYLRNLKLINKKANIKVRLPLAKDVNTDLDDINELANILNDNGINSLEVFAVHHLAKRKYDSLGMHMKQYDKIEDFEMNQILNIFNNKEIKTRLLNI